VNEAVQGVIVALVVAFCAWRAVKRYAPKTAWRAQAALSYFFERPGRAAWSQAVGRRLRPAEVVSGGGCGSGCTTCGGCATNPEPANDPSRIHLQP
jgi:hypothetical protein